MVLADKIMNELQKQKQVLLRKVDKKEITAEVFYIEYNKLKEKISKRNQEIISQYYKDRKKEEKHEVKKEKVRKKRRNRKSGRKPRKNSYASNIEKALKMKTVKSFKDVYAKVNKWKPGKDFSAIKRMTKVIIREVEKQNQPRWKGYKWDEEEFLLKE